MVNINMLVIFGLWENWAHFTYFGSIVPLKPVAILRIKKRNFRFSNADNSIFLTIYNIHVV